MTPASAFIAFLRQRLTEDSTIVLRTPFGFNVPADTALASIAADVTAMWKQLIRSYFPQARFDRLGPAVSRLREVKDSFEIAILRHVGHSSAKAALAGIRSLRPARRPRDAELDVLAACVHDGVRQSDVRRRGR